ncbi:MAG: AzlD domain-containing protein [Clostridia bacterium]|nr:AzlD domain-containing protein [Clostridia bacterium]
MSGDLHSTLIVAVMSACVIFLRGLPFLVFRGKETPPFITYLGKYLPYAIMGMLLVYGLKDTPVMSAPHGIPELIALAVTMVLQVIFKKSLLSIVAGTLLYMFLVQSVF